MKRLFLILIIFVAVQSLIAQEATVKFEQANQYYRGGEFQKAVTLYEQVIKNGYESPALYYNLGNCYFKLQNVPAGIINFERAKRLAPNDDDINYNLRLANLRVIDKIEPIPKLFFVNWWIAIVNSLSSEGWAVIGIVALWVTAIAGAIIFLVRTIIFQRIAFLLCVITLILTALAFTCMFQRLQIEQNSNNAIIFSQSVQVKSAPDVQSTDLFVLHEGVKVEFLDAVGNWRKIRLIDGKIGWLSIDNVQVI